MLAIDPKNLWLIGAVLALGVLAILIPTIIRIAYYILLAAFGILLIYLAIIALRYFLQS